MATRTHLLASSMLLLLVLLAMLCSLAQAGAQFGTCGDCPAGNCKLVHGHKVTATLTLSKDTPDERDWRQGAYSVTVWPGTNANPKDAARITVSVDVADVATGNCFVVGLNEKNKAETNYAVVDYQATSGVCEKVFLLNYNAINEVRVWNLGDASCR